MRVRDYIDEHGLSFEEVAARLAEHGVEKAGQNGARGPYTAKDVAKRSGSEVPKTWRAALGLEPHRSEGPSESEPAASTDRPPKPPPGAKIQPPTVDPQALADSPKRIAGIYRFLGAALASGAQNEGIAVIFDDQADPIGELWVKAAQENPWAARFVNTVNAGGALGDLAAAHLYLFGAVAYVVGAGIPAGEHLYPKYTRYRVVVQAPVEPEAGPGTNGATSGPVGDALGADRI